MNNDTAPEGKDPMLWEIAKKRAKFKKHLTTYVLVNGFLWTLWYFTNYNHFIGVGNIPWPLWSTLGWGLGIAFQYADAYVFPKSDATEREYEKLNNTHSKF
jgi:hypothetical protein